MKLDSRSTSGIFIGYSISTRQYIVYEPVAKTLHCSQDVVFREAMQYTAPNAPDETISNEHCYRDIIDEPKPKEKQPIECQIEKSLDNNPPPYAMKTKKMSQQLPDLETSLGDAWKPPADGNGRNHPGKDTLEESARLALEDGEFKDIMAIHPAAAISDDQEAANNPTSLKAVTMSPLAKNWDTSMTEESVAIGQHQVFGDFVDLADGRKGLPNHWVYKIKRDGAGNVQR